MQSLSFHLHHPGYFASRMLVKYFTWLPDRLFLKLRFRFSMGYSLDLKNPQTFSEKLQWLKLYYRRPEYTVMVDKVKAKEYVASVLGEEYIIPTLGVWKDPDEIDFDKLPDRFVLKCNHNSGLGMFICKDKSKMDVEQVKNELRKGLNENYFKHNKEWPYKDVPRRILAEQYLEADPQTGDLPDYKFSCFDGKVTDVMVCVGRSTGNTKFYFFDKEWRLLPLNILGKNASPGFSLPKPACIDEMFGIASRLSKGLPYARIDLFAVNNRPYFGEITFFPQSGFDKNLLPETESYYGSLIVLPPKMY